MLKFILQGVFIVLLLQICEFVSELIELPIPGSLLGMLVLFLLLETKVIKDHHVSHFGNAMLKHLGFFFIPPAVSLMTAYGIIQGSVLKILILLTVSLFIVMGVTGKVVDIIIKEDN